MKKPISKQELEALRKTSKVHLLDVRSQQEFEKQHIPVAINVPADDLPNALQQFSSDDTFVCVCNHGGQRSQKSAEYLHSHGFANAFYLEGGTAGWFDNDHHTD
ncbi:MAG TPA: rhodanese-like domain-containing protein [Parafilimonas sp.]|nr:rhodanese-like domain-containing protein [Parafilimonas sp.]